MSRRGGQLWQVRLQRWTGLAALLGYLAAIDVYFAVHVAAWERDAWMAVVRGAIGLLLQSFAGLWLSGMLLTTRDAQFFGVTPMTLRQYVVRNVRRAAVPLALVYVAFPLMTILMLPAEIRGNALLVGNLLLLYAACMLAPVHEQLYGRRSPVRFFFPLRSMLYGRFNIAYVVCGAYVLAQIAPNLPTSLTHEWSARITFLSQTSVGSLGLLLVSPLTELALAAQTPYGQMMLILAAVWHGIVVCVCVHGFTAYLRTTMAELEDRNLDTWLEQREAAEFYRAEYEEALQNRLTQFERQRHSPEKDQSVLPHVERAEYPSEVVYALAPEPERQISRHYDYAKRLPHMLRAGFLAPIVDRLAFLRSSWFRTEGFYCSLVVLAVFVTLLCAGQRVAQVAVGWGLAIVLWCIEYERPYRLRELLTVGLSMPLRLSRVVWRDFLHCLRRRALLDIAAAVVIPLLLQQPVFIAPVWWCLLRMTSINAYVITLLQAMHVAGRPWPLRLTASMGVAIRMLQFGVTLILFGGRANPPPDGMTDAPSAICVVVLLGFEFSFLVVGLITAYPALRRFGTTFPGRSSWPIPFFSPRTRDQSVSIEF